MPTLSYNTLSDHLSSAAAADWPAVTLICGEEMLCEKALDALLDSWMPRKRRALTVENFDGGDVGISAALSSMNTYALLSGTKVVVVHEARIFYSANAQQGLREKMTQAARNGEMKKASRPFLNLMALLGLSFEDLLTHKLRNQVAEDVDGEPAHWFSQLIDHCRESGLCIPERHDDADLLQEAMEKGFPTGHRLVITTDLVDRRKTLFKRIQETGLVVDCTVPRGETRADRLAQDTVMNAAVDEALARSGKRMAADARRRLLQWTGFDLRTLSGNLDKLIGYAGGRQTITDDDVTAVLQRTRKDPIFEFTNAIADRNLPAALFFTKSLLEDGLHPLQLLAAAANQIRRLLLAKDFIVRDRGRTWSAGMPFPRFQGSAFKAVQADDESAAALMETWEAILNPPAEGKKSRKAAAGDLVLVKNPKSPFPVFQTLKKADNFSREALMSTMIDLSETDIRLKSLGQDPRMVLEAFLVRLCRKDDLASL